MEYVQKVSRAIIFPDTTTRDPRKRHPKGGEEKGREESPSSFPAAPPSSLTHSSLTEREKLDFLLHYAILLPRGSRKQTGRAEIANFAFIELYVCRLLLSSQRLKGKNTAAVNIFVESRAKE